MIARNYGASECGGISWDASDKPREHADLLGTPMTGVDVSLNESGHFAVRSSSVGTGYHPFHDADALIDGVFHTPDGGHVKASELILDVRGGEHINVAGRKLGPGRIEAAIKATGMVEQVRIFGIPSNDPERVDEIAALLPEGIDKKALREAIGKILAGWQMPRHWLTADDEVSWKLSRAELRERFGGWY